MKPFNHVNAGTIKEAVELLKRNRGLAAPIAGGTDLLGVLKDRVLPTYPETVVNLKTISGLDYIREDDEGIKIGALATLAHIVESPIVSERCKVLAEAARSVATPQIRHIATIGGNLGQEVRCWYYRYPHQIGGRIMCVRKGRCESFISPTTVEENEGNKGCGALAGDNRYHSIFGSEKMGPTPCTADCPAGTDIPGYLGKMRQGDLHGAAMLLLEANPIPAVTGRVCPQPCQQRCNRGDYDTPVSIRDVERFIGDYILDHDAEMLRAPVNLSGKRVAVVGSGPAGLSAAFYLRRSGHEVVVFDRMKEAGGMLAYSIPAFRLPPDKVRRLVDGFKGMGIVFKLGSKVGRDITLRQLKREFHAVFLATGAWLSPALGIKGESLAWQGLEFLSRAKQGINEVSGRKVTVIGGGNVAVDVAVTALRQGASEVVIACLERWEEMPAFKHEIEKAIEEGVKLMPSWGSSRVLQAGKKVKGIELKRCTAVFNEGGHFAPAFNNGIRQRIETDHVIMAVGQRPDVSFMGKICDMQGAGGALLADPVTQATTIRGVFAGGDVTSGPATVGKAATAGRRAAFAINDFLNKRRRQREESGFRGDRALLTFNAGYLKPMSPISASLHTRSERNVDQEDASTLALNEAETEANRCFNCGCLAVNASDVAPVLVALDATIKTTKRAVSADAFFSSGNGGSRRMSHEELITEIVIPCSSTSGRVTCAYKKHRVRSSVDFPVVSLATVFETDVHTGAFTDVRMVLGAVAPWPIRARAVEEYLKGKVPAVDVAEEAATLAVEKAVPLAGNAYKVQIVKTLIKRSIMGRV